MNRKLMGAVCLLAASLAGCTTSPSNYVESLSANDPKWRSPECQQARVAASEYEDKNISLGAALLLGPYGLALAAATQENSEKRRRAIAREVHMRCSSQPLPAHLQAEPRPNA